MGLKEKITDWAISLAVYGKSWWLPLVLLVVSVLNSLTGGALIWCLGVMQSILFPVIVLSHGKVGCILGPLILSVGAAVAAQIYIQMFRNGGADLLLETTGAQDSQWMEMTRAYAESWGAWGLFGLQIFPIPIPSAVLVVTGMLANIAVWKIYLSVIGSKFCQLVLSAFAMSMVAEGKTLEQYLRENFKGEKPAEKPAEENKKDQ